MNAEVGNLLLRAALAEFTQPVIILEPPMFDAAIIGVLPGVVQPKLCYDRSKCLQLLVSQGMTPEDAEEFFARKAESMCWRCGAPVFLTTAEDLTAGLMP